MNVELRGIVKRFGATEALKGVDAQFHGGEIHAILGENGAGKSTLMHVLSGSTRPDRGEVLLDGERARIGSPRAAREAGVAMVHQHFTLVPAFTVAENLALDAAPRGRNIARMLARLHYSVHQAAASGLARARSLGWDLPADAPAAELPVGVQQRVEIVKALATGARAVIFDEPTAVLAGTEVEELFTVLAQLRSEGCTVILIAHKLAEILAIADRVTVLRHGTRVASASRSEIDARKLAAWMMGADSVTAVGGPTIARMTDSEARNASPASAADQRSAATPVEEQRSSQAAAEAPGSLAAAAQDQRLTQAAASNRAPAPEPALDSARVSPAALRASHITVQADRGEKAVRDVTLQVARGEILGIGGVDGNGQAELAEALVGLRPLSAGELTWDGGPFQPAIQPTTGYIPPDRRRSGLAITMTVEQNLILDAVRDARFRRGPLLRRRALRALARDLIARFDIRTPGPDYPVSALSGGNQQKVVAARALWAEPEWIVAVNPTRGLDIAATRFVHQQLQQARSRGAAIVLISTDLDEVAALSDRAAILSAGTLAEFRLEHAHPEEIGLLLGGLSADAATSPVPGASAP